MINSDSITHENNKKHNERWPYIPDHPSITLIIVGSGSGKRKTVLNLINKQNDIDKIYLYQRDLNEPKYEILIKRKVLTVFDDMITGIMTNKKFQAIIK